MTTKKHTKFQQKRSKIAFIGGASYFSCGDFPYNHETNHDLFPLRSLLNFPKENHIHCIVTLLIECSPNRKNQQGSFMVNFTNGLLEGEDIISQFFSSFLKVLFNKINLKSPVISGE